ncbi:MAG: sensor histidine kinase [Candidatus Acidiferrales bacterium]
MPLHEIERRSLERQVTLARPPLIVLALMSMLLASRATGAALFLCAYLALSLVFAFIHSPQWEDKWQYALVADILAIAVFLFLTPSVVPVWFLLLIAAYEAGAGWGGGRAYWIVVAIAAGILAWSLLRDHPMWGEIFGVIEIVSGTMIAGFGMAYLGDRNRQHAAEHKFIAGLTAMLSVESGIAESLRSVMAELIASFGCERAFLVHRDTELERIFLWKFDGDNQKHLIPENLPLLASDGFLFDVADVNVALNNLDGKPDGFAWNRLTGIPVAEVPRIPAHAREILGLRSAIAVTMEIEGQPNTRVMLANCRGRFTPRDLRRLERIVLHLGPPLENLFLLRHLRARAIEAERSRISRDIHDGILQTLLSIEIQLDVLRRKLPQSPEQAASALAGLQQTVRNESAELRRMITDLRPLRVQSADMLDLMTGFAERFRNESTIQVELIVDSPELQAPDRVCREIFQIYREALNNIKKHARASHVVVKLTQSDSRVTLVVDDDGEGFSFAGRFSGEELDRLRLGPISIKEHTRTVGGVLTVESSPGHGARLIVEVPLG